METLGPVELLIILAIVLLVFGSAKLPKLARSLGQASNELKKGMRGDPSDDEDGGPEAAVPTDAGVVETADRTESIESEPEPPEGDQLPKSRT